MFLLREDSILSQSWMNGGPKCAVYNRNGSRAFKTINHSTGLKEGAPSARAGRQRRFWDLLLKRLKLRWYVNTITNSTKAPVTIPSAVVSALEHGMKNAINASHGVETPTGLARKRSSSLADPMQLGMWTPRGIPEMDSPLAG